MEFIDGVEFGREFGLGVLFEVLEHALFVIIEVFYVPGVDFGDGDLLILDRDSARAIDEGDCGVIEVILEGLRVPELEVWTPDGGTIDGVMDSGVFPDGSEDSMFYVVECEGLILDFYDFGVPRPASEEAGRDIDIADRFDRPVLEDDLESEAIVEVAPEGELGVEVEVCDLGIGELLIEVDEVLELLRFDLAVFELGELEGVILRC